MRHHPPSNPRLHHHAPATPAFVAGHQQQRVLASPPVPSLAHPPSQPRGPHLHGGAPAVQLALPILQQGGGDDDQVRAWVALQVAHRAQVVDDLARLAQALDVRVWGMRRQGCDGGFTRRAACTSAAAQPPLYPHHRTQKKRTHHLIRQDGAANLIAVQQHEKVDAHNLEGGG